MIKNTQQLRPMAVLLAASLTAALAGCASADGRYPSLAVRDAERFSGEFTPGAPSQEPAPPVASTAQVSDLIELAMVSHREFTTITPQASRLIRTSSELGRDTGPTSDARSLALVALAQLTSLRSQTAIALANLDSLEAQAATTFTPVVEIKAAQVQVTQLVSEQDATLDSLNSQMSQ